MKASDFIVEYLIRKAVTDVFGYPGGMVTHLMESFRKYSDRITAHDCYHEQGAAFEAIGYAQVKEIPGVAYATSGPGATNLITGICDAWFDSVPVIFITGQVNRNESCEGMVIRQRGFQETNIVSMVKDVTKYAVRVTKPEQLPEILDHAWNTALNGRKGPVLLDIPMDVFRSDIAPVFPEERSDELKTVDFPEIREALSVAERPCILAGAALKTDQSRKLLRQLVNHLHIPVVTSMTAVDLLSYDDPCNFGFIGAYGERKANFIIAKSDLVLSIGSRLDIRQVGAVRKNFAPDARLIRIDIDEAELNYVIRGDEFDIRADAADVLSYLCQAEIHENPAWKEWLSVCQKISDQLSGLDDQDTNEIVVAISDFIPDNTVITTDVGQNQVWVAQSFRNKPGQRILFSGGMGAMGYSLPAAIGACIGTGKPVLSFNGDGGIQMNIQELQFVSREHLPIKIVIFNNHALGMIRHFQEMYFDSNYALTTETSGYTVPDFSKIASAYGLDYYFYDKPGNIDGAFMKDAHPAIVEIGIDHNTYVKPKLRFGQPNQDQEPLIDRDLYEYLMKL